VDEELAGVAEYRPAGNRLVFVHTEVLPAFAGRGIGNRLAAGTLDATRARGLKVTPRCPFIAAYIRSHPEYRDMVVGARGSSVAHGPGRGDGSPDGGVPEAGGPDGGAPGG
jgi:molybdenum cofactor cytidylyltransferase